MLKGRRLPALLVVMVALVAAALMFGPATKAPTAFAAGPNNVHAAVLDPANQDNGFVSVIIQSNGDTDAAAAAVSAAGGTVSQQFHIIPAVEATIPVDQVNALATNPAIKTISLNSNVEVTGRGKKVDRRSLKDIPAPTPTPAATPAADATPEAAPAPRKGKGKDLKAALGDFLPSGRARQDHSDVMSVFPSVTGATDVWDEGVTGQGIGVAVIDTGVDDQGKNDFGNRVVATYVAPQLKLGRGGANDLYGHGTHVAGIIAGDGRDSSGLYMGEAPGANIISVQVGKYDTGIRLGDVIAGLEYTLDHQAQYNIRVANMSFTQSTPESFFTSPLDAAVEQLWFHGITVVVAAGNRGTSDAFVVDHPPANDPYVITVGAFSDNATLDTSDDFLKSWSSRGTTHDGFQKPEIVAPGWQLIATTGNGSSKLYQQNPNLRVGPHYLKLSGTSSAAPVVSGTVALMLQQNPSLTPDQVKARLVDSADPFPGSAAPAVNAYDAVFNSDANVANQGLPKSLWIGADGSIQNTPASVDSITWDSITWDSITWDSITWDSITWDSITWDSITWDSITWDSILWD